MTLISTDTLEINESGVDISDKYPELVGEPKTIMLQADKVYYLQVCYNSMTDNLYIKITQDNNDIVQGMTDLLPFPRNLLIVKDLADYFLFYQNGKFYFGKYDDEDKAFNSKIDDNLLLRFDNEIL